MNDNTIPIWSKTINIPIGVIQERQMTSKLANILVTGTPGVGKTSTALMICDELGKILNRNVDFVPFFIKEFRFEIRGCK